MPIVLSPHQHTGVLNSRGCATKCHQKLLLCCSIAQNCAGTVCTAPLTTQLTLLLLSPCSIQLTIVAPQVVYDTRQMASKAPVHNSSDYPTVEDYVGNTPLVRLQRLSSNPSNVILAKLEGNNPAGSVKDRCALVCHPNTGFLLLSSPWQMPVKV